MSECCYSSKGRRPRRPFELDAVRLPQADPNQAKMLTFFTTAKPFVGHSGVIQRNALKSWTLMHPFAEVILFGNETGGADPPQKTSGSATSHTLEKNRLARIAWTICLRGHKTSRGMMCSATAIATLFLWRIFCAALERVMEPLRRNFLWLAAAGTRTLPCPAISSIQIGKESNPRSCPETSKQRTATGSTISFFRAVFRRICRRSWLAAFFGTTGWSGRHWK